ncbi:MAG TPA: cyclic nucleotide-binding domain-containing protein [Acidimicrobiales bacterium]|nr:cyclic nucleotide-binding domain-containing protein [Acidimicrobiales bacterium]
MSEMPTESKIPPEAHSYLRIHHIITLGTSSFTGIPHAATVAYANDADQLFFSMASSELTLTNIAANRWVSFTIDDYTPDFRKLRELRGVGKCAMMQDPGERAAVWPLFAEKFPSLPTEALDNLHAVTPLELHFVDFEYTAGVAVPLESSIFYQVDPEAETLPTGIATQLETLTFDPGQVVVRQGQRIDRFFIIVEGEVEVRREGHGQDVIVTRHTAGQLFGEVGALAGTPQTATYVAVSKALIMAIDRAAFQEIQVQSATADLRERVQSTLSLMQHGGEPEPLV